MEDNFLEEILDVADGEEILSVVIGTSSDRKKLIPNYDDIPKGVLLTFEEAKKWLNYEDNGGSWNSNFLPIYAWTENNVIIVTMYDGSRNVDIVPRNPIECNPYFYGGD